MKPTLQEFLSMTAHRRVPLYQELYADSYTPVEVLRMLKRVSSHCFLLESVEDNHKWGRYSFLGYDPSMEVVCREGCLQIRSGQKIIQEVVSHPKEVLKELTAKYRTAVLPGLPTFTGGLVGYFSYDYIRYGEPVLQNHRWKEADFRDMDLMLFDRVIAFDHDRQKLFLIAGADPSGGEAAYEEAKLQLLVMQQLLMKGQKALIPPLRLKGPLSPAFSKERYCQMVERAKEYIREGDIFQVVLSNPLKVEAEGSLLDTYRILRTLNPSPYMFYFSGDDMEIAGASPETLVKLEDGRLSTFPLAGTRARGRNEAEDQALEDELLADEKERAEHNMLVDLGRNDLGKISQIGSVKVEQYLTVRRYSHVMHIASTVTGKIQSGKEAADAVDAVLPAGTLSGAPKVRACQIIDELEGDTRGLYGGAVGYLDFTGNMDLCIAIRMAYMRGGSVCVRAGAGIVSDSVPEKEFRECQNKAMAMVRALEAAQGGLE